LRGVDEVRFALDEVFGILWTNTEDAGAVLSGERNNDHPVILSFVNYLEKTY